MRVESTHICTKHMVYPFVYQVVIEITIYKQNKTERQLRNNERTSPDITKIQHRYIKIEVERFCFLRGIFGCWPFKLLYCITKMP